MLTLLQFLDNFNGVVYFPDTEWATPDTLQLYTLLYIACVTNQVVPVKENRVVQGISMIIACSPLELKWNMPRLYKQR